VRAAIRLCQGALVCGLGAALASPASADFQSSEYSYPGGGCSGAIDPVTLVLYGANADRARARSLLQRETGWGGDTNTDQYARSHGHCTPMDGESYTTPAPTNRSHVRYNQTHHRDTKGRLETVGTPHEEDIEFCGHSVVSFISARNEITFAMNPPFGYSYQYWGNTAAMRQCDGRVASSDGYVVWINIG
jgi:hypothetical protein